MTELLQSEVRREEGERRVASCCELLLYVVRDCACLFLVPKLGLALLMLNKKEHNSMMELSVEQTQDTHNIYMH
jgi:hypothetical protein